jgi:hypothetical protein
MLIYQQAGHNTVWNIDSFQDDSACDGIIFSPVHMPSSKLDKVSLSTKRSSLFDPQFYVPDSQKTKLHTYNFFPEKLMAGFKTKDFYVVAHESARLCLDYQLGNDFRALVIPSRYYTDMVSDYIGKQKAFSVEPFLSEVSKQKVDKEIYLTLPLTIGMLQDDQFRTEILNWVTSYPEIDGIYLLISFNEPSKQLKDYDKLTSYVSFVNNLTGTGLKVICGYCNTEGVVLASLEIEAITVGAYENTRGFSIDKFLDDDQIKRGPAPRIYFPKLLNWIRYDTAIEIKEDHPSVWASIYTETVYTEKIFETKQRPNFNNPNLYKAHFLLKSALYKDILTHAGQERIDYTAKLIKQASEMYVEMENGGVIFFDANCKGEHLPIWNRVLKKMKHG